MIEFAVALTLAAAQAVPGTVVQARAGASALLVWDASPVVSQITRGDVADAAAIRMLESDAVAVMAARAGTLPHATTIAVRVVYPKDAFGPPRYGTTTAEADETVLTVTARRADVIASGTKWAADLANGTVPPALTIVTSGGLPAKQ